MCDLVKNLLGPRGGPRETLADMPLVEYITGILAPVGAEAERGDWPGSDSELAGTAERREGDEDTEPEISPSSALSPALDPKKTPSTMGITFSASSSGKPEIDVCVTWARYRQDEKTGRWTRTPKCAIFRAGPDSQVRWFDSDGNPADGNCEISVHVRVVRDAGAYSVSIYVVNRIKVPGGKKAASDHHIFQPQIRVACCQGTRIVPGRGAGAASEDEKEDEVLYGKRESLARGHMTSAVWRDVDPETDHPGAGLDFPECAAQPGFAWADAVALPAESRAKFAACDARTEFVPMHNVMSPDFEWPGQGPPPLKPAEYAQEYDGAALRRRLEPFDLQYKRWIDGLRDRDVDGGVKARIVRAAEDAHRRIKLGIDFICGNDEARLAFCFANRAIDEQAKWAGREGMEFRPFQLGFILMSAESVLNAKSEDRGTCDLLWVPTGGGKTEAYLFLVAMVSAYRRLKAAKSALSPSSGEGVAVISRYTLRLLTIQQFRRTAALFAAMECLRVDGLGRGDVGWRPKGMRGGGDFIWGTAPFSVGLWVGKTVTPNSLEHAWPARKRVPGALDLLKDSGERGDYGEPAQILECPACRSVLATPKMGLKNEAWIHYVVRADKMGAAASLAEIKAPYVEILQAKTAKNRADGTFTLSLNVRSASPIRDGHLDGLWSAVEKRLGQDGCPAKLAAASPSRPGYFIRHYVENGEKEYDFEIFCPNPDCGLVRNWAGGYPMGRVHGRLPGAGDASDSVCGSRSPDGNFMADVIDAFAVERNLSDRVPIPALTVDDQVYRMLPTMVVSTVDKLARIPFEPRAGALFGNVDHHNCVSGYYRYAGSHPKPAGGREKNYAKMDKKPKRPDLIIQDELHLVDGPLGSMVGIYETAVDHLCSGRQTKIKYVASTATAKRSEDHVRALFARGLAVFPPKGLDVDDRFFLRERRAHPLQDRGAGRLYVGVCAPGYGALKPIVRVWSRLAQSAGELGGGARADPFWTIVGYFNTVRELAGARALYRQDIPEWMRHLASLSGSEPRKISEEGGQELSGRTSSTDLPSILDLLGKKHPESKVVLDGLFTTSMFGTGVDVQRLGAMLVNGQPKTSSAYIQSTGRVGRKSGAVVVTLHRASKPRDLNHYEFFVRHHSQLHRFVEPPTVFPFAKRVREMAQGPVMVGMLRNARCPSQRWAGKNAAGMSEHFGEPEVAEAPKILEARSQVQPGARKPPKGETENGAQKAIEEWKRHAEQDPGLEYSKYDPEAAVVLGDPKHEHSGARVVYSNAPQSMRSIEEETEFQT